MKKLERLFRKIGNADVHVWGYSTLGIKKMSSLIRKILSEVGRNEMLSWGYRIEK